MNKSAIRNFAIWARVQLIEAAKQRAYIYEIAEKGKNDPGLEVIGGKPIPIEVKEQRRQLIAEIERKGFDQVMEEAAYTWFNRFIALRFMEVNGYLPTKVRVFTNENGEFKPDILREAMTIDLPRLDREQVLTLLDKQDNEALFKLLIIAQCNALSEALPNMFETIANWTELLFPGKLLKEDSVIGRMIADIAEDDWTDEVEIIGWMYQYYISEKHDQVVSINGKSVKKEDVPAATQLFTTDWVVRYILDNSLGRYWIERHPDSQLASKLQFLVIPKSGAFDPVNELILPEELRVFDPCVGSGHFLSYAFDVLMEIYRESGWSDRDAAKSIVENNLYGLDIDDRAGQLAYFAVLMKARKYNRRILNGSVVPNVLSIRDSSFMTDDFVRYFVGKNSALQPAVKELQIAFVNAKEYGSITLLKTHDYKALLAHAEELLDSSDGDLFAYAHKVTVAEHMIPLIKQAIYLTQKYPVVATNPPYLNKYSPLLKSYISENYEDYKGDLFSVFMYHCFDFCVPNGYSGFMTPMVWMFIKTYEAMRSFVLKNKSIASLIQFEYSAFEEATVPICAFVLSNGQSSDIGYFFRLSDFKGGMTVQQDKILNAIANKDCGYYYEAKQKLFSSIPGSPLAYWVSEALFNDFQVGEQLGDLFAVRKGLTTADNNRFLRIWFEVETKKLNSKWFGTHKGGEFRKWYGNNENVINWEHNGHELKSFAGAVIRNEEYYFRRCITWNDISSSKTGFRYVEGNSISNASGPSVYGDDDWLYYALGLCNSSVVSSIFEITCPTIHFEVGRIAEIPVIKSDAYSDAIIELAKNCVGVSKSDWDSFETSWDFQRHPLFQALLDEYNYCGSAPWMTLKDCYHAWEEKCTERFNQLKANEEELNRIFIDIYGLQDELTPDVADKDVTVRRADLQRDIKSLISYAVGCMLGRYSLNKPGLCFAGGSWEEYIRSEEGQAASRTYAPDVDGVLPITDDEYFGDDIVTMFEQFIKSAFGDENLEENLKFIADALGGSGSARSVIRNYFLNDFYADHLKIYQKRPIYWLFDAGKKNSFKCLIYMHRYQPDTIARIRTDYIHELQSRYRTAVEDMEKRLASASAAERVKLNKQLTKLKDQELELRRYEEKIHHLADQMIAIDLDDGVKVNYARFEDVLAKIK